tara:strand:+ start:7080 stop:7697 length:618 start_codon:yes stop_codon:yes gene_type:complete
MAIDHESQMPWRDSDIKELDKKFHTMFAFPKVFSELNQLSNSKVKFEIKLHIMRLLQEIVIQFENEDKRASQEANRHFAWAFLPIATGWRRLAESDFKKEDDGNLQILSNNTHHLGTMMYQFGAMNFSLLTLISRSPYGKEYQNRYHRNLMTMIDHMGAQIPQKVNTCAKTKIFWKTENMGLGNQNAEEPLIHILEALFRGIRYG